MGTLSLEKQSAIIASLCEGVSIRATERLQNVHRDTVMRLGVQVGQGCTAIHGSLFRNLQCARIELDEVWSFVKKKRRNVQADDPETVGDQYVFFAMDSSGKAIISWLVGKRTARNTQRFMDDLRFRVINDPEFSTDGWGAYPRAIDMAFEKSSHGTVDKQTIIVAAGPDRENYYARETLIAVKRVATKGAPSHISTSYIERQNLTLRQSQRRLTRLTNGFSKKFENHCAAIALYSTYYNLCRIHESLRITPAMQLGVTDHVWSVSELVTVALSGVVQKRVELAKRKFTVIEGGKRD